ncbi:SNF2-related protein [Oerskovia sp. NPDC060338]|uniref:SNF2-related protein n=1 Tax=Oerskovia sp. NPDC060338 TaxID=3347100 RepID=UPI003655F545
MADDWDMSAELSARAAAPTRASAAPPSLAPSTSTDGAASPGPQGPRPTATLGRTWVNPALALRFARGTLYPGTGQLLIDWIKKLPGRQWDPERSRWVVTGLGKNPTQILTAAGFDIDIRSKVRDPELATIDSLEDLQMPLAVREGPGTAAVIYPRLIGFDEASKVIPAAAEWDRGLGGWRTTCVDLAPLGVPRRGIVIGQDIVDVSLSEGNRVTTAVHLRTQAASVAASLGTNTDPEHLADLIAEVGDVPEWFGGGKLSPYAYQRAGAIAVAAGHSLLADAPGVGKTLSALAAAAIVGARRIVVLSPAKVISSWVWHSQTTEVATGGGAWDGQVVPIVAGRKEPALPDAGVVVLTDALIASRPALLDKLVTWAPDVMIYDEAHRAKQWASKRAVAARELAAATTGLRIAASGTPMNSSPEEMASQLEVTGHLGPVFGGHSNFLETYCRKNHFGAWVARKSELGRLKAALDEHVWVRRNKSDVLRDLPAKARFPMLIDVPLTEFRKAHTAVLDKIDLWLQTLPETLDSTNPEDVETVEEWARDQIGLMSPLRVAAGLAKVPAAAEYIGDWVAREGTHDPATGELCIDRPLIVWAHHQDVATAMIEAAQEAVTDASLVRSIVGGTPQKVADAAVADFQAGKVAVIVLSITAAGVGLTLTRSSDVLFVETTYVNAEITQAEDRAHRIGTKRSVTIQTMIAPGTLDERIQAVLGSKSDVLDQVMTGGDNRAAVLDASNIEMDSPAQIISTLAWEAVARSSKARRRSPQKMAA